MALQEKIERDFKNSDNYKMYMRVAEESNVIGAEFKLKIELYEKRQQLKHIQETEKGVNYNRYTSCTIKSLKEDIRSITEKLGEE